MIPEGARLVDPGSPTRRELIQLREAISRGGVRVHSKQNGACAYRPLDSGSSWRPPRWLRRDQQRLLKRRETFRRRRSSRFRRCDRCSGRGGTVRCFLARPLLSREVVLDVSHGEPDLSAANRDTPNLPSGDEPLHGDNAQGQVTRHLLIGKERRKTPNCVALRRVRLRHRCCSRLLLRTHRTSFYRGAA